MKIKLLLTLTVTLIVGIALGVVGSRFLTKMKAYANAPRMQHKAVRSCNNLQPTEMRMEPHPTNNGFLRSVT